MFSSEEQATLILNNKMCGEGGMGYMDYVENSCGSSMSCILTRCWILLVCFSFVI